MEEIMKQEVQEIATDVWHKMEAKEKDYKTGGNMEPVLTSNIVPTLGGYGYGYGRGDCDLSDLYLKNKTDHIDRSIGNQGEFTRRDIADTRLAGVMGNAEIKDAIQNQTLLDTMNDNRAFADVNANIVRQSAQFEQRLNSLENQATLRRELDCQTEKILMGQELQTQKILLDAYHNPKPTSILSPVTCDTK